MCIRDRGNSALDDAVDQQMRMATAGLAASDAVITMGRALRGAQLRDDEVGALRGLADGFIQEAERLRDRRPRARTEAGGYVRSAHALAGATLIADPTHIHSLEEHDSLDKDSAIQLFELLGETLNAVAEGDEFDQDRAQTVKTILRDLSSAIQARLTTSGESSSFPD